MNFFKRKTRRTTLTISDQTKSSKASLSSSEGRTSQLGSTSTLRKTETDHRYQTSETVEFNKEHASKENSLIRSRGVKHTRFSDDTNENNNSSSGLGNDNDLNGTSEAYPGTGHTRDMTLLAHPVPNLQDMQGESSSGTPMSLYASVIKGDKAELKKIISANDELLDTADNFGRTPLMYCVLADRLDCAKFLISRGCNLDQVDNAGRSALHSAAHKGSYKFLELLRSRGASLDIKDNDGQTALHLATRIRTPKCLEFLLRNLNPGMVDVPDNLMRTALHWGAAFNNTECVKLLIKYGINIAIPDGDGKTPLHWAANNHDPSAVHTMAALLEKSPGVLNWQDYEGRTALHFAVADGNSATVEFLVNFKTTENFGPYSCDVERSDNTFRTPLHWAAQLGHTPIVKLLLHGMAKNQNTDECNEEKKVKNYASDGNGATPFLYAALSDHHSVVEVMIEHDLLVIEQVDIEGRNALMWAAGKGSDNVIRLLLGIKKSPQSDGGDANENLILLVGFSPVDVNKTDNKGNTALHVAAWNGHGSSVELLLSHNAKHDIVNQAKHTPIFGACEKGHVNVVKYLLDYNASVTVVDSECRTPLHWAALGGHAEVCELLIKEGLDVDVIDTLDRTPLHCAAFGSFINCMNLLLENGANVDLQDQEGRSALHWAAQSAHSDAIKLLFQYGVFPNPMEYTEERLTPLDHALQKEREDILNCLIEQGAMSAEHIRNIAATKIKANFRGYKVRKTFHGQKELLMQMLNLRKEKKEKEMEEKSAEQIRGSAAVKIQTYYRGFYARKCLLEREFTDDKDQEDANIDGADIKPDVDSGSYSPENISFTDVNSKGKEGTEPVNSTNILSHDEGVICDQLSVISSQSSLHSNSKKNEGAVEEDSNSQEKKVSPTSVANLVNITESDKCIISNLATPENDEKKKRRRSRKSRTKALSQSVVTNDSDSSKDSFTPHPRRRSSSSPLSLRSSSVHKDDPTVGNKLIPVPPSYTKKKDVRRKRVSRIKDKNIEIQGYLGLDKIGDENNIQSEKVKDIAYKSYSQDIALSNDELPQIPACPVKIPSATLSMSEYIESLMKMSSTERKLLIEHQNKRKEAFRIAMNAARIIQNAWMRFLEIQNPELHERFQTSRRKSRKLRNAKKKENRSSELTPDTQTAKVVGKTTPEVPESFRSANNKTSQKSVLRSSVASSSISSVSQIRSPRSEASRPSIMSSSDVQSGNSTRKRSKTRRPKTVGLGQNAYVSIEKVEELSRIYGNRNIVRDMLATTGSTSFPSINSSRTTANTRRPITVAEKTGRIFQNGPDHTLSPRTWTTSMASQKQKRSTETSRNNSRAKSSPAGHTNPDIDIRLLPLQWQRLYGELQNADAADEARRKYSTRFSYNLGEIQ